MDSIKYLGATITHDLRWITYISNICTRRKLCQCPQDVKQAAYKELEYDSCVMDPKDVVLQEEIEKFLSKATWFVTCIY